MGLRGILLLGVIGSIFGAGNTFAFAPPGTNGQEQALSASRPF